ncbi:MAG TPA: M23 family metallopeptidase [Chitinophagaceae bacterium]|nr:M23 family metallopeptidase [Chitinophagaceae bacterium]
MKSHFLLSLAVLALLVSCNSIKNVFGKDVTPHEVYADKIDDHPMRKQWLAVSGNILHTPSSIRLPYKQLGFFPAGKPRALALAFTAQRGEQVNFMLQTNGNLKPVIYADIYKQEADAFTHVMAAETDSTRFGFNAEETGTYILRLQPELDASGEYALSIIASPSLGFPVAGNKARIASVWGDSRDNGERKHEGIDIMAAKLTPAIAAADGTISSVKNGGLGGKTINLKVEGRNLSLYYAHLDKQLVYEGQNVKKGDTIGLVGNTGNASGGAPHLHFGIYTYSGAIDPLAFVKQTVKTVPDVKPKDLTKQLQLTKAIIVNDRDTIKSSTILTPLAVTAANYLAELPDGTIIEAPFKSVKTNTTSVAVK